jgi:hypothetical protein
MESGIGFPGPVLLVPVGVLKIRPGSGPVLSNLGSNWRLIVG